VSQASVGNGWMLLNSRSQLIVAATFDAVDSDA
jgi:hypothetical protein